MPRERVEILVDPRSECGKQLLADLWDFGRLGDAGPICVRHVGRADGSSDVWVVLPVFTNVEERAAAAAPADDDVISFVEQQLRVANETGEPFRLEPWQRTLLERYVNGY